MDSIPSLYNRTVNANNDIPAPLRAWAEARLAELDVRAPAGADRRSPAQWTALPVEASHRRFYRLGLNQTPTEPSRYILMASPPALENNDQFARLARLFGAHGIGVPAIYAQDAAQGYFLLEDLGNRHFADLYQTADEETALAGALETLLRLQTLDDPAIPPYSAARFADELQIFSDWFVEGLLAETLRRDLVEDSFGVLVDSTRSQPQCCVHRDFHCRNLLLRADGRVGVVDFQDALKGPASYDLASLLRDCYHHFDEATIARWRDAYVARSPLDIDAAAFPRQFDLTALQRQLKAIGIFARLARRDGKTSHLPWIVPVLTRVIEVAARYPELGALTGYLQHLLPRAARKLRPTS
jgi:aminoglycoside/choline kinase family phosphotransferase